MALEKNIKEVIDTNANIKTNAASKNDAFASDESHSMVLKVGTNRYYWCPDKVLDASDVVTYIAKTVLNLIATNDVRVGEKIEDVDDSDLNIQFDSGNSEIIINIGGSPILTFKSTGVLFSNGWEIRTSSTYFALYKDNVYAGWSIGEVPSSSSSSSSSS